MIYADIGSFDLENSRIDDVLRSGSEIAISFKSIFFKSNKHQENEQLNAIVRLSNVTSESATQHLGGGVEKHADLSGCPIEIVELASIENGTLNLQGYKNNTPWFSWEITALSITIEWGDNRATAT
ncbi:hypothetical protein PQS90_13980 [Pseudomonas sp. BLCC-B13]|uniref:hypothetical protein n=1 Tax=Pseudomonas sp. BLCC-B13 TaxID=3025314 RepID=UPI00234F3D10|nr:hypothetical protein [Pseudomonas sp. BLCC-B13]MDC7826261.1 hypothetical protein [Pseudomonas sp. BLCC-B13]